MTGSLLDPSLPQPIFVESCWVALFLAASVTSLDVKTLCLFGKSYTRIKINYREILEVSIKEFRCFKTTLFVNLELRKCTSKSI